MRLLGLMSGNFKAKDNPRTFKSSTNTNFIVRRMEGIETNLEKEMPAFRGTGPFLFCYRLAWKSEDYYPLDKTRSQVKTYKQFWY